MRLFIVLMMMASSAFAQDRRPSHCIAIADAAPGISYVHKASFRDPIERNNVRIQYLHHSSFLIQTDEGVSAVTDFTGLLGAVEFIPDVVTMNYAHSSHWTAVPDPAIPHVLQGWGPYGEGIEHHVEVGDMLVRNVSTDIRRGLDLEPKGNSIFVFEAAGLCIGHLGHLHHEPDDMQYAALGRLDVVMAAVDGGRTLDVPSMVRVMKRLRSSVIIPMHWFDGYSLNFFLTEMKEEFDIERGEGSAMTVSVRSLPDRPTVYVLSPELLFDPRP